MYYVCRNYYTSIDMKPFSLKQATIAQVDMEIDRSKNVIVGHICLENCDSHKIHFNLTLPSSWFSGKYIKKTLLLHEKETSSSWRVAFSTYPFRFKTCPLLCFLYIPIKSRNAFHLPIRNGRSLYMAQRWFHSLTPKSLSSAKLEPCLQGKKNSQLDFSNWETGSAFNIQLVFKKKWWNHPSSRHPSSVTVISTCDSGIFTVFLSFNGPTGMPKAWWKICPDENPLVD